MIPAAFQYQAPTSLRQALSLLARHGEEARLLAGGHSLIPMMKFRLAEPSVLIDLGQVPGLAFIQGVRGSIAIGAMTTHYQIETSPLLQERLPALSEAASLIADVQVRNRGTIGGSLAHVDPAADYPAVVLALNARIKAVGPQGGRFIKAEEFFVDMLTSALAPDEILTEVRVPIPPPRTGAAYEKFANKASHFAVAGVCASVTQGANGRVRQARVAITGAASVPTRARGVEKALTGQRPTDWNVARAASHIADDLECLSDVHGSAEYRAHLCRVLAERAIHRALARTLS